jgi:hypothetical protein
VTNIRTHTDPEGSNRVGLTMDIPDIDAVMAMMQTQEGADAMVYDGASPRASASSQRRSRAKA